MRKRVAPVLSERQVIARLKAIRKAKGMTASDLAAASGVSANTIYNLEGNRRYDARARLDDVIALSQALGLDVRDVLSPAPIPLDGF